MFNHWVTILLTIAAVGGAIGQILGWFKPLVRWFQSRRKSKVRQKGISLSFVSKDPHCRWSVVQGNNQSGTFVSGVWNVTNRSEWDVTILKARLSKYPTLYVHLFKGFGAEYPIHPRQMSEVSADFTFFPPIGRAPKPIISDVIFTDNYGNEYRVRTQFPYVGPVHEPSLWSRLMRR